MKNIQRYTELELPIVPYIPGITPRKTVQHTIVSLSLVPLSRVAAEQNTLFLFGVDLFNAGYFWEAHEAWEELWHREDNRAVKQTLQGLIQLTAGWVKIMQQNEIGGRKLFIGFLDKYSCSIAQGVGITIHSLYSDIARLLESTSFIDTAYKQYKEGNVAISL